MGLLDAFRPPTPLEHFLSSAARGVSRGAEQAAGAVLNNQYSIFGPQGRDILNQLTGVGTIAGALQHPLAAFQQQPSAQQMQDPNALAGMALGPEAGGLPPGFRDKVWAAMSEHPSYARGTQELAHEHPVEALRRQIYGDKLGMDALDASFGPDALGNAWVGRGQTMGDWESRGAPFPETPLDTAGALPRTIDEMARNQQLLATHIQRAREPITGSFLRNLYLTRARLPGAKTGY